MDLTEDKIIAAEKVLRFFNEVFELRHSNDYDDFIFCDEDTYVEFRPKASELISAIITILND